MEIDAISRNYFSDLFYKALMNMKKELYAKNEEDKIDKEIKQTIWAIGEAVETSTKDDRIKALCLTGYLMSVCNNMDRNI